MATLDGIAESSAGRTTDSCDFSVPGTFVAAGEDNLTPLFIVRAPSFQNRLLVVFGLDAGFCLRGIPEAIFFSLTHQVDRERLEIRARSADFAGRVACRSGGIGRRAWFRSTYSQGCGGSSPFFGTKRSLI